MIPRRQRCTHRSRTCLTETDARRASIVSKEYEIRIINEHCSYVSLVNPLNKFSIILNSRHDSFDVFCMKCYEEKKIVETTPFCIVYSMEMRIVCI